MATEFEIVERNGKYYRLPKNAAPAAPNSAAEPSETARPRIPRPVAKEPLQPVFEPASAKKPRGALSVLAGRSR